jgi:hypothetical protein
MHKQCAMPATNTASQCCMRRCNQHDFLICGCECTDVIHGGVMVDFMDDQL